MSVNRTVENVYLRQEAMQLTRKHFWPLVGMSVVVNLVTNVVNRALTGMGDLLMIPEVTEVVDAYSALANSTQLTSTEPLLQSTVELFTSPKFIIFNLIFMLVTGLVGAGLNLGRTREMLDAVRGNGVRVTGVFGLMRYCLKALLLNVWATIKAILWMLPGVGVMLLGGFMANSSLPELGNAVMVIGLTLFFGLWIPALVRYDLAFRFLADEPARGIHDCVKQSCALMKGRKWQYVKLQAPAWLKILGMAFVADLALSLLESLLALDYTAYSLLSQVLITVATIYFVLQLDMVCMAFYEKVRWPDRADKPVQPVSSWLREHTETDIEDESPEETGLPAESTEEPPADTPPETNEEKENEQCAT